MNHSRLYDLSTRNHTLLYDFMIASGSEALEAAARQVRRVGRPTQNNASQKSENLLEVATALFAERGFHGTTMLDIAEERQPTSAGRLFMAASPTRKPCSSP
jgi:acetylornithine/succinyldiaminopimelate/putrescine aminotransferase